MLKETREKQVEKMIFCGLENLFKSQDTLDLDRFCTTTLEGLMLLEREEYLKKESVGSDIGNGTYMRTFKSLRCNSLQVNVPRTRSGKFKPMVLEIINKSQVEVNELAILLYRKGLSSRDVSYIIEEYFGESMSKDTIINLAQSFHEIRMRWEERKLDTYYKVVFCDALYINLKRGNSYSKEAAYVIYGVKEDNTRELLLIESNPTEGSSMWGEYFEKLKKRGVEQIDLVVADGLTGLADAVRQRYPNSDFQKCVVHLERSILNKVRPKDKQEIAEDLKKVFNNFGETSTKQQAIQKAKQFTDKLEHTYPNIAKKFHDEELLLDYFTYIGYDESIRRMVYTTNSIENLNRQIRKVTKTKVTFEKESNMLDLIFMVIIDFEAINWQKYPVSNFQNFRKKHN